MSEAFALLTAIVAHMPTRYHNELLLEQLICILLQKTKLQINQTQLRQLHSFGCIAA
jgi:hypothetical protein